MLPLAIARLSLWLSPIIKLLPEKLAIKIYSSARTYFMQQLYKYKAPPVTINKYNIKILWGLAFRLPLMNSAGMFKNGEGYDLVANQGAGAYIGGTSTYNPREGNTRLGIHHPFISLAKSHISLNYLGLPNLGDIQLSKFTVNKQDGCPVGWSLMRSPDYTSGIAMEKLIESLWLYHDNPTIDFLEINESCPNLTSLKSDSIDNSLDTLENRLLYIGQNFLSKRKRHLPVILKLSNDLEQSLIPKILDVLFLTKFDGINLGNTSTNYAKVKLANLTQRKLFNYFVQNFGGGIGGNCLKKTSLNLCSIAVNYAKSNNPGYEFHVIRSGGVSSIEDIIESENAGISLNQWYTGYFENYIKHGDALYASIFNFYKEKNPY
ncbi:MAG: hypothetical protein K0R94_914 [Burkholderiales bacterium]|jgi:dihydroorotate dehydrogenase|nr:hypothetical protein [Burkholderiales bacterium]